MHEKIKEIVETVRADHWKLVSKNTEVCQAQFPAQPGQDSSSLQSKISKATFELQTYREVQHAQGHFLEHRSFEGDSSEPNESPLGSEPAEMPWFPLEIHSPAVSQPSLSSFSKQKLQEWILPLQEILQKACEGEKFLLQSEFIRLERLERIYLDSFGRELVDLNWLATLDLLILPRALPDSQPVNFELRFSEFSPQDLLTQIQEKGENAVRFASAKPWNGKRPRVVYLRGHLIGDLMALLMRRLTGLSLYTGLSHEKIGSPIFQKTPQGDTITLGALASLYNSPYNSFFDDQGLTLSRHTLIEGGIVKSLLTSQETAFYLNLPLTGLNSNFSLAPGTLSKAEMSEEPALEILRWRTFDLDEASGRWSAVAEEAYYYENKFQHPVFGVRLFGTLEDLLTKARFSQEIGSWENYTGPEFLQVPGDFLREEI
jgi:predicted Zn-dependent protease